MSILELVSIDLAVAIVPEYDADSLPLFPSEEVIDAAKDLEPMLYAILPVYLHSLTATIIMIKTSRPANPGIMG